MVISKKIDYRKRKKRDTFFGIPYLPLIIVLILVIVVLILPTQKEAFITGKVIAGLSLTETEYEPEDDFEGNINLMFYREDLIPWDSSLVFEIESIKCNYYYVCENSIEIPWQTYDFSDSECEDVDDWPYYGGPWEECGQPDLTMYECEDYDKECCSSGNGLGFFYANLECDNNKECWDDCSNPSASFLLRDAINTKSTTPWKGNYTSGNYRDANGTYIPGTGWGFSACSIVSGGTYAYPAYVIYPIIGKVIQQPELQEPKEPLEPTLTEPPSQQQPLCIDSDGGRVYGTRGTCSDSVNTGAGTAPYTDYCIEDSMISGTRGLAIKDLREYYCYKDEFCVYEEVSCEKGCNEGACIEEEKGEPDLVVSDIERETISDVEGLWITMKNIGDASTAESPADSFHVEVIYDFGTQQIIKEYTLSNIGYEPGSEFGLPTSDIDITGLALNATATVDSTNVIEEEYEDNNQLSKWLLPYSCDNWNNIYVFPLDNFDFETPDYPGFYTFIFSLKYGALEIDSYSDEFEVVSGETHMACQDYECVAVSGAGTDQCSTDSDCLSGTSCNEYWLYGAWSSCVDNQKQRECYDSNNCGTTYAKPSYCVPATGNRYIQVESCCNENWRCDEWSACYEHQGLMVQSMICKDLNECSSQNFSYTQLRDCCIEEWVCEWAPCINGKQEKICKDISNCGTEFTKPAPYSKDCRATLFPWWAWVLITLVLIAVIFAIFYVTKHKPKKQDTETKLKTYIKKALEGGMSKEQAKAALIKRGWPENLVNNAFTKS